MFQRFWLKLERALAVPARRDRPFAGQRRMRVRCESAAFELTAAEVNNGRAYTDIPPLLLGALHDEEHCEDTSVTLKNIWRSLELLEEAAQVGCALCRSSPSLGVSRQPLGDAKPRGLSR